MIDRRRFLRNAAGLLLPAAPALILPREARAMMNSFFPGPGTAHSTGGASPTYSYLGTDGSTGLPGATFTSTFTMPNQAGLLVFYAGIQSPVTITSVVYDPAGANVALTQDAFTNSGHTAGVWSGVVSAFSGSKTVVVTASASMAFLAAGSQAWLARNLTSNVKQTSAAAGAASTNISVTAGDFLIGGALSFSGSSIPATWAGSPQAPAAVHDDANNWTHGADWTISSTNASFFLEPKNGFAFDQAYATYR